MKRPNTLNVMTAVAVLLSLVAGLLFVMRSSLPSADVIARQTASRPIINVSDFTPGEVKFVTLNSLRVIVWRRDEADKSLAASQNSPADWRYQNSPVLGQTQAVFADDANLTLNGEWFFAVAEFSNPYKYLLLRAGDFGGILEGRYAGHFDLAGRIRKGGGRSNLTVINAEYVDDGKQILLDLDGTP